MQNEKTEIELLVESEKYTPLTESDSQSMKLLLKNAGDEVERMVNEGTLSGDVAQFTPILMPMVRRVYPTLIANHILGVQVMPMSTGYIYALVNQYVGSQDDGGNLVGKLMIVETTTDASADAIYSEGDFYLMLKTTDTSGYTDPKTYTNEAAFDRIFQNYTGTYTTAEAEQLGNDMREVGFQIIRKNVEVKSRALKGQYSVEMYEDLKKQHGLFADEEIMSLMSYEIQAEIDRECVDFVNDNATQLADTTFTASIGTDGRYDIERFRHQAIRIQTEAAQIGLDTKRGQGNILIVSPKVLTMLRQLDGFKTAEVNVNLKTPVSGGLAGTFDNQFKVIVDQYAVSDYCTVLYKGSDRRDAMGFFCPYSPLSFTKVTKSASGQPAIIAKTRYALDTIPGFSDANSNDRAKVYARSFGVDFSNTILAS